MKEEKTTGTHTEKSHVLSVVIVICLHWATALSMVFINKKLISLPAAEEPSPNLSVVIVWAQTMVGAALLSLPCCMNSFGFGWARLPKLHFRSLFKKDMILAASFFTTSLILNNLMLGHISVAFYQLARSLTLVFVVMLSLTFLKQPLSSRVILSCSLVAFGFFLGVDQERFSKGLKLKGVLYGVAASFFSALCGIFYKRVQNQERLSALQLTLNNQVVSLALLSPLILTTELPSNFLSTSQQATPLVYFLLLASGAGSLLMSWVSAQLISLTSPLTHSMVLSSKAITQTLLAVAWSGETRTPAWWLGNALVMVGIAAYSFAKLRPK